MYHAHFKLKEQPFGTSPDCRYFHQTVQHREALATLYYSIQQRRGFSLLVGGPGLGKTSILVKLVQLLEGKAQTAYLPHPYYDKATVLDAILVAFGLESTASPAKNHRTFFEYLTAQRLASKTCVVIFDEAQDLDYESLEAIRMLSNFETPTEKLVQIVLAGQLPLAEKLSNPAYEQLRQRMTAVSRLEPMDGPAVREYINHRLQVAGAATPIFEPAALDAIIAASGGIPRNINTLCFNSLTIAFALNHSSVGPKEVAEAVGDLDLPMPKLPLQELPTPKQPHVPQPAAFLVSNERRSFLPAWIAVSLLGLATAGFFLRGLVWAH